ncbi:Gp49 family protein [Xanthomonas sacchari]
MSIEQEIQAKGLTAPRVRPADIEAEIIDEHYFTAEQGYRAAMQEQNPDLTAAGNTFPHSGLRLLTFCVLVLRNGFTVTGESACASPENFDSGLGRFIARRNAEAKVLPLLGFRLRDKLAGEA